MKHHTHELWELVQSLSVSEMGSAKKYINRQAKDKKYGDLLGILHDMSVYNEKDLKKRASRKKLEKNLIVHKHRLKEHLQDFLVTERAHNSVKIELRRQLEIVRIYTERGIYSAAERLIPKIREKAKLSENFWVLIECLLRERAILQARQKNDVRDKLESLISQTEHLLAIIANLQAYRALYNRVFAIVRGNYYPGKKNVATELKEHLVDPLMKNVESAQSFEAKDLFYGIKALYYRYVGDFDNALEMREESVKQYQANNYRTETFPQNYIIALSNYATMIIRVYDKYTKQLPPTAESKKRSEEMRVRFIETIHTMIRQGHQLDEKTVDHQRVQDNFPELWNKFRQGSTLSEDAKAEQFQDVFYLVFLWFLNNCQFDKCVQLVYEIDKGLRSFDGKINEARRLSFYYNIIILYFVTGDFEQCQKWVRKTKEYYHRRDIAARLDIRGAAYLLHPILSYQLQDFDGLDKSLRTAKDYFGPKKKRSDFELLCLDILTGLLTEGDAFWISSDKNEYLTQLAAIKQSCLLQEEFTCWLISNFENRKIEDVYRQMYCNKL